GHLTTPAISDKTLHFNWLCALDAALPPPVLFTLMGAKSRKWWLLGLGVVLLGFLLYHSRHVLNVSGFSGVKLWDAIRGANYTYLFVSIVVIYLVYAVRALRWQKFQTHVGRAGFWNIYALKRILDAASTAVLAAIGLLVFESSGHSSAQGAQAFEKGARTVGIAFSLFTLIAICLLVY